MTFFDATSCRVDPGNANHSVQTRQKSIIKVAGQDNIQFSGPRAMVHHASKHAFHRASSDSYGKSASPSRAATPSDRTSYDVPLPSVEEFFNSNLVYGDQVQYNFSLPPTPVQVTPTPLEWHSPQWTPPPILRSISHRSQSQSPGQNRDRRHQSSVDRMEGSSDKGHSFFSPSSHHSSTPSQGEPAKTHFNQIYETAKATENKKSLTASNKSSASPRPKSRKRQKSPPTNDAGRIQAINKANFWPEYEHYKQELTNQMKADLNRELRRSYAGDYRRITSKYKNRIDKQALMKACSELFTAPDI